MSAVVLNASSVFPRSYVFLNKILCFTSFVKNKKASIIILLGKEMADLREIFAKNLKKNRRICGFSQAKLAEMAGVSTHHIAMIELKRNFPTSDLMERIAKALNIKVYELFLESDSLPSDLEKLRLQIKDDFKQAFDEYILNLLKSTTP